MENSWNKIVVINDDDVVTTLTNVCEYDANRMVWCATTFSGTRIGPKILEMEMKRMVDGKYTLSFRTEKLTSLPRFGECTKTVVELVKQLHKRGIAHGDVGNNVMYRRHKDGKFEPVLTDYVHAIIISEQPSENVDHWSIVNYGEYIVDLDIENAAKFG